MGTISGKEGYIYSATATAVAATSAIGNIDNWTMDMVGEALETTAWNGSTISARTFIPGLKTATGTLSGNYDNVDVHQEYLISVLSSTALPDNVAFVFYINATHYFTLSALMTGISIGSQVAGKATFSANYQLNGGITYT